MLDKFGLSANERRLLRSLNTPEKVQRFLDELPYNMEDDGETLYSPRMVMRKRLADCIEGAVFAAAALRLNGHKPLIVGLHAVRDDCHVIAVFQRVGLWGALSKSKYTGLRFREPVYRNMRELALSYFEDYFNFDGEKTLRGFTGPIDLSGFDAQNWISTEEDLFAIDDELFRKRKKVLLFPGSCEKHFAPVAPVAMRAGELWMREKGLFEKAKSK